MKIKSLLIAVAALVVSVNAFAQDAANDVKKKYNEAVALVKAKNFAEALPLLEQAADEALTADVIEVFEGAQKLIPTCYFRVGLSLVNTDTEAALANLNKADELGLLYNDAKTSRQAKAAISKVYKVMGANAFNNKQYAEAAEVFAKGYAVNPQDTDLALNLAMSYCESQNWENGVKVYTDIIALESRHSKFVEPAAKAKEALSNYLLVKAQGENEAGDKEAAYATLETLVNADQTNGANQMFRLQMAGQNQDWDKIIEWAELAAAFQVTPEEVSDVYYLLGAAYDSKNLNAEAIAAYKQVVAGDKVETANARAKELDEFIKAEAAAKK